MKFSTAWHGFRNMTPSNYFSSASALGISNVEVPMYDFKLSEWFGPIGPEQVRQLAQECGVEMVAGVANLELAAPFDELGRPNSESAARMHQQVGLVLVDMAWDLGLSVVRVAEPNIGPENQHLAEEYISDFGEALRPIGDYAESRGIKIAVENYGFSYRQMDQLLEAAGHRNVGTLFDPCNYARMGEDPLAALKVVGDRMFYCHLKDTKHDEQRDPDSLFPGSRWRPSMAVGDGDIDWYPLLSELTETYDGYVSIEYEHADDVMFGTRRALNFVLDILESISAAVEEVPTRQ